jgi:phosphate transport system substrate-binding protein
MNAFTDLFSRARLPTMLFTIVALASGALWLSSCDTPDPKSSAQYETATTGTAEVLCDESIVGFMQPTFKLFDASYNGAAVSVKSVSAREAMTQLFGAKARGVVIARSYLRDEDSLLKANKLPAHASTIIATDALVFVVQRSFPLDTISLEQLKMLFTSKTASLRKMFPMLKVEPTIICPDANSSEYGNILLSLTRNAAPQHVIWFVPKSSDVKVELEKNPNAIGVGYLSRYAAEPNLKMLKIGFQDSSGVYVRPKTVHQSYVLMGKYPLPIKIQGLLLEDQRNLPWGFITFLRNDVRTKEYFLKNGIVPEGARFTLIPDEN